MGVKFEEHLAFEILKSLTAKVLEFVASPSKDSASFMKFGFRRSHWDNPGESYGVQN